MNRGTAGKGEIRLMIQDRIELYKRISDFLFAAFRWGCMDSPAGQEPKPTGLMIDLLEYQRLNHPLYGTYCSIQGRTERGSSLLDYPPLPVECFKRADLCPFAPEKCVAEFHSSGTTEGVRSIHKFCDPGLMQRSQIYAFSMLTGRRISQQTRILSLMPSYESNPHSSLGYMISSFVKAFGAPGSGHFFSIEKGLDVDGLCAQIEDAAAHEAPVHLMGPAFAYVELLDRLGDRHFTSAPGSCLLETGGYKGKSREIPRHELRDMLSQKLGIERRAVYGEYGMCELSSQAYEISALNTPGDLPEEGLFIFPNWMRCILFNPENMSPVLPGNEGQIALFDLCNLDSAAYILTGDVGTLVSLNESLRSKVPGHPKYALRLKGRAENAVPKGCSMAWEEWARSSAARMQ